MNDQPVPGVVSAKTDVPTASPLEPDEVLDRAADLLMIYGRTKKAGVNAAGEMCVLGAMNAAEGREAIYWERQVQPFSGRETWSPAARALGEYLASNGFGDVSNSVLDRGTGIVVPYLWNDQTDDDDLVIDSLRRCAKDLRG